MRDNDTTADLIDLVLSAEEVYPTDSIRVYNERGKMIDNPKGNQERTGR